MKISSIVMGLFLLLLTSCEPIEPEEDTPLEHETEILLHNIKEGDLEILIVDDCEYIAFKDERGTNHGFGYLAHKGNCKNPIHCHNQKIKIDTTSELNNKIEK